MKFAKQLQFIRQRRVASLLGVISRNDSATICWRKHIPKLSLTRISTSATSRAAAKSARRRSAGKSWPPLTLGPGHACSARRDLPQTVVADCPIVGPRPGWGDRFHDPAVWGDKQKLLQLARDASDAPTPLPAQQLAITGILLKRGARVRTGSSCCARHYAAARKISGSTGKRPMPSAATRDSKKRQLIFASCVALRPENPWILTRLADVLAHSGQVEECLALDRRAVELEPTNVELRHNLALDLVSAKRYDEAETECRRILKSDPDNVDATLVLAFIFSVSDRPAEAVPIFRRVVAANPTQAQAWYELGRTQMALGHVPRRNWRSENALNWLRRTFPDTLVLAGRPCC